MWATTNELRCSFASNVPTLFWPIIQLNVQLGYEGGAAEQALPQRAGEHNHRNPEARGISPFVLSTIERCFLLHAVMHPHEH